MSKPINYAYKEWASAVHALAAGEQTLLLRKGGIHETGGKFAVESSEFLFFPTYEHQKPEDLSARGQRHWQAAKDEALRVSPGTIPFTYYAAIVGIFAVRDQDSLLHLEPFHIWSEATLRRRYDWGGEKGVTAIAVRVFPLRQPVTQPLVSAYGGCRSWVRLNPAVTTDLGAPVMTDAKFQAQLEAIHKILL